MLLECPNVALGIAFKHLKDLYSTRLLVVQPVPGISLRYLTQQLMPVGQVLSSITGFWFKVILFGVSSTLAPRKFHSLETFLQKIQQKVCPTAVGLLAKLGIANSATKRRDPRGEAHPLLLGKGCGNPRPDHDIVERRIPILSLLLGPQPYVFVYTCTKDHNWSGYTTSPGARVLLALILSLFISVLRVPKTNTVCTNTKPARTTETHVPPFP